jgi:hypothetical protein
VTVSQSIARFIHALDIDRVPPEAAYDALEGFVAKLPHGSLSDLIRAFALLPRAHAAAA